MVILITACSDSPAEPDGGPAVDSMVNDGAIADASGVDSGMADSSIGSDGTVSPDASIGSDGMITDAGGATDAGGLDITQLCQDLCDELSLCVGGPPDPACYTGCGADLLDCSNAELNTLQGCAVGGCTDIDTCIGNVACFGGGTNPVCGDGTCDAGEDCNTCPGDCGSCMCGDGICSPGECITCVADCPSGCIQCGHDICTEGAALISTCETCVSMVCAADSYCCDSFWDGICVSEVETVCNKDCPSVCGDFVCDADELSSGSCPEDCGLLPPPDAGVPDDAAVPDASTPSEAGP